MHQTHGNNMVHGVNPTVLEGHPEPVYYQVRRTGAVMLSKIPFTQIPDLTPRL